MGTIFSTNGVYESISKYSGQVHHNGGAYWCVLNILWHQWRSIVQRTKTTRIKSLLVLRCIFNLHDIKNRQPYPFSHFLFTFIYIYLLLHQINDETLLDFNHSHYDTWQWNSRWEEKEVKGGKQRELFKEQEKEFLQELTGDICLTSLDARGKAFYLNTCANDVCIIN